MVAGDGLDVVWFKRDLRLTDHAPLRQAAEAAKRKGRNPVLVMLLEPGLLAQPDSAFQHHAFALECAAELAQQLPAECPLWLIHTEALPFFEALLAKTQLTVYSHQETGNWASFERDKSVAKLLKQHNAPWLQYQTNAVVRGPLNRDEWSKQWLKAMDGPPLEAPEWINTLVSQAFPAKFSAWLSQRGFADHVMWHSGLPMQKPEWLRAPACFVGQHDKPRRQRGGRTQGLACLQHFLRDAGRDYRREMSSPLSAPSSCSRVSPYLTFGALSMREVLGELQTARNTLESRVPPGEVRAWKQSYQSFEARLHWHCHFIQKLETEPELEWRAAHRGLNTLRNAGPLNELEQQRLQAWIEGRTGFPMIDACMRMLHSTGWVNFRMRAMLVAFASYQLWLDWRHTAPLLAQQFLDYEPGIHYPQFQMQSGVTGINTLRIYNPVKQAHDQDPTGEFIRQWLPELVRLPTDYVGEPWALPGLLAQEVGFELGRDYPAPVVDPATAIAQARAQLTAFRNAQGFAQESARVYSKHGSRNPNRNGRPKPKTAKKTKVSNTAAPMDHAPSDQLDLF